LTERMLMDDVPAARHTLQRLRAMGIRIAVDDFGTGLHLAQPPEGPATRPAEDRSLVHRGPSGRRRGRGGRHAIVRLATNLSLGVVAEGVETADQLKWLAAHGCDEVQGHLIAPPMDTERFGQWLLARRQPAGAGLPS